MKCYLCEHEHFKLVHPYCRDNKEIQVIECEHCGLVTLSCYDHIDDRHYQEGKMHVQKVDISQWLEETQIDDQRRFDFLEGKKNQTILDFGCGNGGFLLLNQTIHEHVYGIELEENLFDHFCQNNLKVFNSIDLALKENIIFDLITAFHVFEHLKDPIQTLKDIAKMLKKDGEIIIEVPNSNDALLSLYKSKAFADFTYWSQHLFLYNEKTMSQIVLKAGMKVNWIKQIQRYPLSNHLYWLAFEKPGGHHQWQFFNDQKHQKIYEEKLASMKSCDTIILSIKNDEP